MAMIAGSNDLCPCGSGLKYKKCCLNKTRIMEQYSKEELGEIDFIPKMLRVANETGDGFYRIFWDDVVDRANPIKYYKDQMITQRAIMYRDWLLEKNPFLVPELPRDFFVKYAQMSVNSNKFWEIKEQIEVPENLLKLFKTTRKRDQEALLKGASITPDQLYALIFKSYQDYGYLYSRYRFEHLPKGLDGKKKPLVAELMDGGTVETRKYQFDRW